MAWNLNDYETVDTRIGRFYADHPQGRILTFVAKMSEDWKFVLFRADVYRSLEEQEPSASGFAYETAGSSPVNKTSHIENCETSAIGRALANLGYAAKGQRPTREEMSKATKTSEGGSPRPGNGERPRQAEAAPTPPPNTSKAKSSSEDPVASSSTREEEDHSRPAPTPEPDARTSPSSPSEGVEARNVGEVQPATEASRNESGAEAPSDGNSWGDISTAIADRRTTPTKVASTAMKIAASLKASGQLDTVPKISTKTLMDLDEDLLERVVQELSLRQGVSV